MNHFCFGLNAASGFLLVCGLGGVEKFFLSISHFLESRTFFWWGVRIEGLIGKDEKIVGNKRKI
jgi:hypothetical protein